MIKVINVMIRRDAACHIPESIPAWEVPLLQSAHDNVTIEGEQMLNRDAPEATDEYKRLETRYGRSENEDGSRGVAHVAAVYGNPNGGGIQRLADAIKAATVVSDEAADLMGEPVA